MKLRVAFIAIITCFAVMVISDTTVKADHQWGSYHWSRTANPFTLQLGNNLTGQWGAAFAQSIMDWNHSSVLQVAETDGGTNARKCRITTGRVEVCNDSYGNTGWLGIAGISVSGGHITGSYVKLNDTYYDNPPYNTEPWRNFVMCQEIGHAFGLDHQDEAFNNPNLGTCMDYTNDPLGPLNNEHPNAHDYEQLETIYNSHTDTDEPPCRGRGCNKPANGNFDDPREWGEVIRRDDRGRPILYVRNMGHGKKHFTHVYPIR